MENIGTEGLSVIGIPLNESIPDWLIPHIGYTTIVNSVLVPFKSVTETFNIPSIEEEEQEERQWDLQISYAYKIRENKKKRT